jgi:small-conductance mechanosensitive channel/CRP-like cAMP-binding protein
MPFVLAAGNDPSVPFDQSHTFSGPTVAAALVLIGILLVLLPADRRRQTIQPLVFLVLAGFAFLLRRLCEAPDHPAYYVLRGVELAFLLASLGRSAFLVVVITGQSLLRLSPDKIFLDVIMALVYLGIGLFVLSEGAVNPTELFQGSAILTLIVGLSMQSTLGNIFSGLAIQVQKPFDVGDWIQFDDKREHIGKVREINWRATTVVTLDDVDVVIPNSKLADLPLTNFTKPETWSRRSIYFVCPYSAPPRRVQAIILAAIRDSWGVLESPAPSVVTNAFTDRGVEYWLRFFTVLYDKRDGVDGAARDRVWYALQREGITMPIAAHDVRLRHVSPEQEAETARHEAGRRAELLSHVPLFAGLPGEALERLAAGTRLARYFTGEVVIRQGDAGSELFIIQSGEVAVSVRDKFEKDAEVQRLGGGAFFGEMSLLAGDPRTATVRVTADCELLVIGKPALAAVFANAPELLEVVSNVVSSRHAETAARLAEMSVPVAAHKEPLLMRAARYFRIG